MSSNVLSSNIVVGGTSTALTITFQNYLASQTVQALVIDNTYQTLNFSGAPTGGSFTLSYNGVNSGPIAYSTTLRCTSVQYRCGDCCDPRHRIDQQLRPGRNHDSIDHSIPGER